MILQSKERRTLLSLWWAGVTAVKGETVVADAMRRDAEFTPDLIIAVGKAASSMCQGAIAAVPDFGAAIVVTKYGHVNDPLMDHAKVTVIESGHPQPDENSLLAGDAVLNAVHEQGSAAKLLMLISGGASSLVEVLPSGMSLAVLQEKNRAMLANALSIDAINRERMKSSGIKGGKLLREFRGSEVRVYAISDVSGDDIGLIGSGLADVVAATCKSRVEIVGSNQLARKHVVEAAIAMDLPVRCNEESLYGDVFVLAARIAGDLKSGKVGIYVWGGEATIQLPDVPGEGGRNQSLALAIGQEISDCKGINVLVAGTDGSDGPTSAAGAFVDGNTFRDGDRAKMALMTADAGAYLEQIGDRVTTGPTNTNVMDIVVAVVL